MTVKGTLAYNKTTIKFSRKFNMDRTAIFIIFIVLTSTSLAEERTNKYIRSFSVKRHHRVRRMLGTATKCVPKLKEFCRVFTYGKLKKKFCFVVRVKDCTALD